MLVRIIMKNLSGVLSRFLQVEKRRNNKVREAIIEHYKDSTPFGMIMKNDCWLPEHVISKSLEMT